MSRLFRTVALSAALTTAMSLSLAACGGNSDDSSGDSGSASADLGLISDGTLKVCSDVPYPPFEDFDKSAASGFTGFDIDLMQKIADGLKVKLAVQDSSFEGLQSGASLNAGQCDVVASAMTITDARAKNLDFSDPYYDSEQSLMVPEDSDIASIDDLAGHSVGVQSGTTGKTYTEDNAPDGTDIRSFPSDAEMYAAIKAGQVDALLQDLPVNLVHVNKGGFKLVGEYKTDESYGFAVKKGNTALKDAIDEQLGAMRDDGTYDKIYDSYFKAK